MKHIKETVAAAAAMLAFAAAADPVTQYFWWTDRNAVECRNADGDKVTWTNGNDAVWKYVWNANSNAQGIDCDMHSLTYDSSSYQSSFWLDNGYFKIGEGGLTFAQRGWIPVGKASATDRRLTLTASQEWRGTQTGTERSAASIGYIGYAYTATTAYYHMRLGVQNAVEWWKMSGLLDVWIGCQNDQLGNVDVTVEAPARLILARRAKYSSTTWYPDARLNAKKLILKGDGFQLPTDFVNYPYTSTIDELAVNTLDAAHLAPVLELVDGADISLTNGLFAIPSVAVKGSGTSEMVGSFSNNLASTSIAFSDGATLFLNATVTDGAAGPSAIGATGNGTLKINLEKYAATGAVTLGAETTLRLAGVGATTFPFTGGAAIELDIGEGCTNHLNDAELAEYVGRPVKVKSGALLVQSQATLPAGLNLVEDGGVVVYASDCPLIVTDIVRQEASITVGAGEEMLVFGNGLTSATALSLTGGTVTFMRTATIASPISVSGAASQIATYTNGICGTIAGAVTAEKSIKIFGPGRMEFTAGATFSGETSLYAYDGEVEIRNGNYAFGTGSIHVGTATAAAVGNTWYGTWCRKFVVGDGANVTFTAHEGNSSYIHVKVYPLPDGQNYKREAVFEVATNGTVTLPNTSDISLGDNQNIGTLHINGGTLRTGNYGRIRLGYGQYATGRLIIDSGTLRLGGYIIRTSASGMGYVTWNGGTIRVDNVWYDGRPSPYLFSAEGSSIPGKLDTMRVSVNVAGDDCVLDLTGFRFGSMTNMIPAYNGMFNEWWGHGQLTVKGGKNFTMTSIPDGMRLRLEGDGTTVTLPSSAKVYDYDTCLTNCQWRRPYGTPATYNVTNSWLSSMTFANVTLAGTNCAFICERDATPVYATNVTVAATGVTGISEALPEGTVLGDVAFESGATWLLGATPLALPGTIAFGDSLRVATAGLPSFTGRRNVAVASEGAVGAPSLSVVGPRRSLRMGMEDGTVFLYQPGTVMLFR